MMQLCFSFSQELGKAVEVCTGSGTGRRLHEDKQIEPQFKQDGSAIHRWFNQPGDGVEYVLVDTVSTTFLLFEQMLPEEFETLYWLLQELPPTTGY